MKYTLYKRSKMYVLVLLHIIFACMAATSPCTFLYWSVCLYRKRKIKKTSSHDVIPGCIKLCLTKIVMNHKSVKERR